MSKIKKEKGSVENAPKNINWYVVAIVAGTLVAANYCFPFFG
jgi:hypothetical protein